MTSNATTEPPALPERLWLVHDLRGIAAILIVVFHYHHFYLADAFDRANIPPKDQFPYATYIGILYSDWASKAVELFWIISGVVFAHVYFARATGLWQFAVARIARLYPLHLLTLGAVGALQAISLSQVGTPQIYGNNDLTHFLLHLLMASNATTLSEGLSFNGPFWSVSLEIPVYGLFFLCLVTFRRLPALTALTMGAVCWVLGFADGVGIKGVQPAVFECGGYFFLGAFLWTLYRRFHAQWPAMLAVTGLAMAAATMGAMVGNSVILTAAGGSALVLAALALDRSRRTGRGAMPLLGDLSYAIYLVHVPIQIAVLLVADLFFGRDRSFADHALTLPAYLAATLALSWLVHRHVELPGGRAIRRMLLPRVAGGHPVTRHGPSAQRMQ
ncbi:MAG: acyltransferase [Rhodobacteraceae bacterium]|nr:acyltransferase [Paracoccaceae bacterium]